MIGFQVLVITFGLVSVTEAKLGHDFVLQQLLEAKVSETYNALLGKTVEEMEAEDSEHVARDSPDDGFVNVSSSQLPVFTWKSSAIKNDAAELIVSFPDGGPDEIAMLESYDPLEDVPENELGGPEMDPVDPCIFRGNFKGKNDTPIAVNGCPGNSTFGVTITTNRSAYHIFEIINGTTYAVRPPTSDELGDQDTETPNVLRSEKDSTVVEFEEYMTDNNMTLPRDNMKRQTRLPSRMEAKIILHYDRQFYLRFRSQSINVLRRIMSSCNRFFISLSLGTYMRLRITHIMYFNANLSPNSVSALVRWINRYHSRDGDLFLFQSVHTSGNVIGRAAGIGTSCNPSKGYRTGLTEYLRNTEFTGEIMAHEIGHVIGLRHDFYVSRGRRVMRRARNGARCTNVNAVMDYSQRDVSHFSQCSREDFLSYYGTIYRAYGGFCLAYGCQTGKYCYLLNKRRGYNCNHWYFKEYCRRACRTCY